MASKTYTGNTPSVKREAATGQIVFVNILDFSPSLAKLKVIP